MTSTKIAYVIAVFVPFGLVILGAIALVHIYRCRKALVAQVCAMQG
ncbi:MAG: hypothetical protein WBP38_03355 [Hyphomicrobium sp.]|nr:hypothetical protein [Hyphomicrobium sp.]